jgi:hypothetical protein
VILTGTGGDEWLGVTPYYAADLLRRGDLVGLYRLWAGYARSSAVRPWPMAKNVLWRFGARDLVIGLGSRMLNPVIPGVLSARRERLVDNSFPAWAVPDAGLRRQVRERALAAREQPPTRDFYRRELDMSLTHPLVSLDAEEVHENGLRAGAPIRQPFWDPDLIQFLARTPPELLNQGGRSKGVVRDMVARQFPGLGFERQRKIVATPFAGEFLLAELPGAWNDLGGLRALSTLGVVDGAAVDFEANRIFREQNAVDVHRLWYLITLEAWVRGSAETRRGGRRADK